MNNVSCVIGNKCVDFIIEYVNKCGEGAPHLHRIFYLTCCNRCTMAPNVATLRKS